MKLGQMILLHIHYPYCTHFKKFTLIFFLITYVLFFQRSEYVNDEYNLLFCLSNESATKDEDNIYQNCSSQILSSKKRIQYYRQYTESYRHNQTSD